MSAEATGWAYEQVVGNPTRKLVLVGLADAADRGGVVREVSVADLARVAETGDRTVRGHLRALEEASLLRREAQHGDNGARTANRIRLYLAPEADDRGGGSQDPGPPEADDRATRGHETPDGRTATAGRSSARTSLALPLDAEVEIPEEMQRDAEAFLAQRKKVDGKVVTPGEMAVAACAMAAFNEEAGTDQGLASSLERIVMRVRERPSWDAAKHVRLVRSAFRIRWWERNGSRRSSRLTPAVIYGNAPCFENVVQDAKDEHAGNLGKVEERRGKYDRKGGVTR